MDENTERARGSVAAGRPIVMVSGEVGGLVLAADVVRPADLAFAVRHGSGLIRVTLGEQRADALQLPRMWRGGSGANPAGCYAVCVDAAEGIDTGISAHDRTITARLLAEPSTRPEQLRRPGHVIPVRVGPRSEGYASACSSLLGSWGLTTVAVYTDVVDDRTGDVAGPNALHDFALRHGLPLVVLSPRNPGALRHSIRLLSADPSLFV